MLSPLEAAFAVPRRRRRRCEGKGRDHAERAREAVAFREPLVVVDVAALSYGESATALRVRGGTVTRRLHSARRGVA
jgi:predicted DNA-binding protein (UPF0251 family)